MFSHRVCVDQLPHHPAALQAQKLRNVLYSSNSSLVRREADLLLALVMWLVRESECAAVLYAYAIVEK